MPRPKTQTVRCAEPNCRKRALKKNPCESHYKRKARAVARGIDTWETESREKTCRLCQRPVRAKNLCRAHYRTEAEKGPKARPINPARPEQHRDARQLPNPQVEGKFSGRKWDSTPRLEVGDWVRVLYNHPIAEFTEQIEGRVWTSTTTEPSVSETPVCAITTSSESTSDP